MEDSIISWFILLVLVNYGFIKVLLQYEKELEERHRRSEEAWEAEGK